MNDCTYNSQCFELNESAENNELKQTKAAEEPDPKDNGDSSQTEDDQQEQEPLWSIDDTLFHPIGLINHGSGGGVRSVFVVWSEDYLLNFVFKKSARTQRSKMSKVRLSLSADDDNEQILDLLILECNTLLLMLSGRVFYFSSVRSAQPVPWLSDVRCISEAGCGFSVIRLLEDASLSLEIYRDVVQLGKCASTLWQRFDITYDERNLFNSAWRDEHFTLHSQPVQEQHVDFLELVCGQDFALNDIAELHFFTVSGSVFVLIPAKPADASSSSPSPDPNIPTTSLTTPAYQIQLLSTYASNIEFIKILLPQRLCLIFLECGSIDIWFHSHIARALRRTTHHTGSAGFADHTFDAANARFYYTDASQVAQLQFNYDTSTDSVHVQQMHKPIAGMLALTWVEHIQQLIALSWNNIFYQLIFAQSVDDDVEVGTIEFENSAQLFELTPRKLTQLLAKAQVAEELLNLPRQLHAAIECQYQKQQLIMLSTKTHLYGKLFDASVEYSLQVPSVHLQQAETVLLYTQSNLLLQSNSLFALIHLKIFKNDIFQVTLWNLHIFDINSGKMHILNIPSALLHHNLCIVLPTQWKSQSLLPAYHLKLLTFVSFESDFLAIRLPIDLKVTSRTFGNLFSATTTSLSICSDFSLDNLIDHFNKKAAEKCNEAPHTISHIFKLERDCTFANILALFRSSRNAAALDVESNSLQLHFMSAKLQLTFINATAGEKFLKLTSTDAAALHYANLYLFSNLKPVLEDQQPQILMYQSEIERCYGTLMAQNDSQPVTASTSLHLEHLKCIYNKMRNDFGKPPS